MEGDLWASPAGAEPNSIQAPKRLDGHTPDMTWWAGLLVALASFVFIAMVISVFVFCGKSSDADIEANASGMPPAVELGRHRGSPERDPDETLTEDDHVEFFAAAEQDLGVRDGFRPPPARAMVASSRRLLQPSPTDGGHDADHVDPDYNKALPGVWPSVPHAAVRPPLRMQTLTASLPPPPRLQLCRFSTAMEMCSRARSRTWRCTPGLTPPTRPGPGS